MREAAARAPCQGRNFNTKIARDVGGRICVVLSVWRVFLYASSICGMHRQDASAMQGDHTRNPPAGRKCDARRPYHNSKGEFIRLKSNHTIWRRRTLKHVHPCSPSPNPDENMMQVDY